jgi:hypothetical protein
MEWINSTLAIILGLLVRLAIPIFITAIVIVALRAVDKRWQDEANQLPLPMHVEKPSCWDVKNCTPEQMNECPSPKSAEPCWQIHRQANGYLREECLSCVVFRQAPIPTPTPLHS